MQHLAGLTRLQYVFCYPESGDIVIAGPAEAWAEAPSGRTLGIESGRPVLELQTWSSPCGRSRRQRSRRRRSSICSIDPTPEGLAAMQQFLRRAGRPHRQAQQGPGAIHRRRASRTASACR